jgi:hypothetical protein
MKTSRFFSIALITALVVSCKDTTSNPQPEPRPKIYFETEYVNFARGGYSHNGWFIDTSGAVISYDIGKSGIQWIPNPTGYYTEAELWAKIHHNDTLRGVVSADTLELLRGLATSSVAGTQSDTVCPGADMGALVYSCYVFQPDSTKFRRIELRVDGDCRHYNTSQSAIELANWMARK